MKINVDVVDIALTDVIDPGQELYDDEDVPYQKPTTLADLIAKELVSQANTDLHRAVRSIRTEVLTELIREAIAPVVAEAVAAPVQKTNSFGEPVGEATTLREVLISEARKYLAEPIDKYNRDKGSTLHAAIRAEIDKAFRAEIRAELEEARKTVRDRVVQIAAQELTK